MTGTDSGLFTQKYSWSYLNHLVYCSVIKHLKHQWIVYRLDHLFSFCCLWYPFILQTNGLEFSSYDGQYSGSTFSAGPSYPNGQLVEKFCVSKEITASSCLRVLCSWKILWTVKQQCIKLGVKDPKTCGNTHMASGCLFSQQHSLSLSTLWTMKQQCIKLGVKDPKTCGNTHMASGCLSSQQHSLSLSTLCSLHRTKQQPALASNWKWAFPCKLSTQQLIVLLLTMPTNSADYPTAEQADQLEHRIKAGLSSLLAAFTAHYQKGVHIRVPIRKEQHCLTAWLHCQASKAVTKQHRPDKPLGTATLSST